MKDHHDGYPTSGLNWEFVPAKRGHEHPRVTSARNAFLSRMGNWGTGQPVKDCWCPCCGVKYTSDRHPEVCRTRKAQERERAAA